MAITFSEARRTVRMNDEPNWIGPGVFQVGQDGAESRNWWLVRSGAAEWITSGLIDYAQPEDEVMLVSKLTGQMRRTSYVQNRRLIDGMTPVHDPFS